ncbi:MAG: pilus (MSHA type) biogenesis protein MshL [Opitutus sp.]|nr:pilus (MSHA type) biogenesis protein MshL [Opitutus sp.]
MKKIFALLLVFTTAAFAAELPPLDRPVDQLRLEKAPLPAALRALGRACQTTIIVEPDVTGETTVELTHTTLRTALAALTEPYGIHYEESETGIFVRRLKTVLYLIDYPQLTRSGSGSASITLGGTNSGGSYPGTAGPSGQTSTPPLNGTTNNGAAANGLSDATQISITQANENTFWSNLETELRAMLKDGETLVLNRFSGVVQVTAPARRHAIIKAFIELTNHRITQQVEIEARLVEVTLRDEKKLGVDWDVAAAAVGGLHLNGAAPLDVSGIGGDTFFANTLTASLVTGQTSAVIHALQLQGEVKTVSQPRLRALNNQTAFIKVGQDQPFFRLQQSTSLIQPGTTTTFHQTQNNYAVTTITIGTILAVTPQIGADRVITLDVLPAITRLQSIVTSPDGTQTAPVTEVKQASTIVRLRDGETAVIGGLIADDQGETVRGIPILSSVPFLGRAFRTKATLKTRSELVIFLTPHLL